MRKNRFCSKSNVVRSSIMLMLLLTLFLTMSFTTFAQDQQGQGLRSHTTVSSLQHVPSGKADLMWNQQSQALTATIHLSGLEPGSNHAAHIHTGTCSSKGHILYPFTNIVANAAGSAVLVMTVNNVTGGIPACGWNITLHKGSTAQTGTLLCGDVLNPTKATSVSVPLRAEPTMP